MLPRVLSELCTHLEGDRLVPHYLSERDEPWLRALLDEHARFVGQKRSAFRERLREPLPTRAPKAKLRMTGHVLDALGSDRTSACVPPKEVRWLVFRAAARGAPRELVLQEVAASLSVNAAELEAALFADLRGERRVAALPEELSPSRLALEVNRALVASLLRKATRVRISAWGNTRALVRHARLLGLICVISRAAQRAPNKAAPAALDAVQEPAPEGVTLDISGPFALFRRTEVYGRALASLVPRAAWCHHFELEAACAVGRGGASAIFTVRSGDPVAAGRELRQHDSKVEERFARDFSRAAPAWDVVREPEPVESDGSLVFPDFELRHRREPSRRWLLEIVGFWTREYLTEKLRRLRAAGIERLILCIDQKRCCDEADLPPDARIVRYTSRVDPRAVLAIVDPDPAFV